MIRVRFLAGAGNFSLRRHVQTASGAHTNLLSNATPGILSLGVKRPGREINDSPPSSAKVLECVELKLHSPVTTLPFV
jgi:hypothetical protein